MKEEVIAAGGIPCWCGKPLGANGKCIGHVGATAIRDAKKREEVAKSGGTKGYCSKMQKSKTQRIFGGNLMCIVCTEINNHPDNKEKQLESAAKCRQNKEAAAAAAEREQQH